MLARQSSFLQVTARSPQEAPLKPAAEIVSCPTQESNPRHQESNSVKTSHRNFLVSHPGIEPETSGIDPETKLV